MEFGQEMGVLLPLFSSCHVWSMMRDETKKDESKGNALRTKRCAPTIFVQNVPKM